MTPKELYPIGTQLITQRLSQAALAYEFGFWVETQDSTGEWCNSFHVDANVIEIVGEDTVCVAEFASTWRVIVTAENQKWFSPVPMEGDLAEAYFEIKQNGSNGSTDCFTNIGWYQSEGVVTIGADIEDEAYTPAEIMRIVERTYPNGQRAPLIEFDEVILPKTGE